MNDMSATIIAKSDQINACDLIGAPRTITVKEVRIKAGEDQPVSILIEGDSKAFRPCLGVRRLLVRVWGRDAKDYIGKSMTLFCDPSVTWAGKQEGGIRVSHMTGLSEKVIEFMRTSRTATKPYTILPLVAPLKTATKQTADQWAASHIAAVESAADSDALDELLISGSKPMVKLQGENPDLWAKVNAAYAARRGQIEQAGKTGEGFDDDAFGEDGA